MSSASIELTAVDIINRAIRAKRAVSIVIQPIRYSDDVRVVVSSCGLGFVHRAPGISSARGYAQAMADVCEAMGAERDERDDTE